MQEYYFNEITSTQEYAKEISLHGKENFVVFSDIQSNGHGRYLRTWESPKGGLWFSFDNDFSNKNGLFTIIMGVAIRDVLERIYNRKVKLKWPNDLMFNNKKVGGIICERVNNKIIIGIGINTNVKEIKNEKATTFIKELNKTVDNKTLMKEIVQKCKEYLEYDVDRIIKKFRENMAYIGEECFVSALNEKVKILNIADDGKLIVETKNGIKEVFTGEINECI